MSTASEVRRPAVAGRFYPARPATLRDLVVKLLESVPHEERPCVGVMVPHAGLQFSGECAAQVLGRIHMPDTVVIVAPNHTGICESPGVSLWMRGAFRTPLGDVPVNEAFAERLAATCELAADDPSAHAEEHAVEVVLPFLQVRLSALTIVPMVVAFSDWERCESLGRALAETIRGESASALLLASSDMTHFESAAAAETRDRLVLEQVKRLDGAAMLEVCRQQQVSMCGRGPAASVLEASRALGATRGTVIDYRHSGLVTGDFEDVVAYAGVILS